MNSSKMLRVGMPVLGLCVFSVFISGCRSVVLADRPSVPPAEREMIANEDDLNIPAPAAVEKFSEKDSAKIADSKDSKEKVVYPRFEDTDHTPIYSVPAKTKKSSTAAAASGSASTYIVRRGDSLSKIAARHRVRTIDLAKTNNLQLTSVIRVGQKLTIPGGKAAVSAKRTEKSSVTANEENAAPRSGLYVVRRGDSVSRIAKRCKVKRADLMAINNINENTVLRIGQTLKLPGAQVVDETSVIVDTENKSEETVAPAAKTESSTEADVLKEMESNAAPSANSAESTASAETAAATAAEAVAAEKTSAAPEVAEGGALSIQQDINIDDFCKFHNVSKDELIRLNSAITESTVILKKGDVIILP